MNGQVITELAVERLVSDFGSALLEVLARRANSNVTGFSSTQSMKTYVWYQCIRAYIA